MRSQNIPIEQQLFNVNEQLVSLRELRPILNRPETKCVYLKTKIKLLVKELKLLEHYYKTLTVN